MCESDRLFGKRFKSPSLIHMSNGILGQSSKSPSLTHASEHMKLIDALEKCSRSPSLTYGSNGLFGKMFKVSIIDTWK